MYWLLFLIDGVRVPETIWHRRQLFGEHAGARFERHEIPSISERTLLKKRWG